MHVGCVLAGCTLALATVEFPFCQLACNEIVRTEIGVTDQALDIWPPSRIHLKLQPCAMCKLYPIVGCKRTLDSSVDNVTIAELTTTTELSQQYTVITDPRYSAQHCIAFTPILTTETSEHIHYVPYQ